MKPAGQILGDHDDEHGLVACRTAQHDDAGLKFVPELVSGVPQRPGVVGRHALGQDLDAVDPADLVVDTGRRHGGHPGFQLFDRPFHGAVIREELLDSRNNGVRFIPEQAGGCPQGAGRFLDEGDGGLSAHGLDPANARGDARFREDFEAADIPREAAVGAAAQLLAEGVQGDDPDPVAVFFLEQGHGAGFEGLVRRHFHDLDRNVLPDVVVDPGLDPVEVIGIDLGEVGEVEAKPVGCDQGARLLDVIAQDFTQNGVEDVGGRMIGGRGPSGVGIHRKGDGLAPADSAAGHHALVDDHSRGILDRIGDGHLEAAVWCRDLPDVTDLAARGAVKRRFFDHHLDGVAFPCGVDRRSVLHQEKNPAVAKGGLVADEGGKDAVGRELFVGIVDLGEAGHRPRFFPLFGHLPIEGCHVQGHVPVTDDVPDDIHRKTEGVV